MQAAVLQKFIDASTPVIQTPMLLIGSSRSGKTTLLNGLRYHRRYDFNVSDFEDATNGSKILQNAYDFGHFREFVFDDIETFLGSYPTIVDDIVAFCTTMRKRRRMADLKIIVTAGATTNVRKRFAFNVLYMNRSHPKPRTDDVLTKFRPDVDFTLAKKMNRKSTDPASVPSLHDFFENYPTAIIRQRHQVVRSTGVSEDQADLDALLKMTRISETLSDLDVQQAQDRKQHRFSRMTKQAIDLTTMGLRDDLVKNNRTIQPKKHFEPRHPTLFRDIYKRCIRTPMTMYVPKSEAEARFAVSLYVDSHLQGDHTLLDLPIALAYQLQCSIDASSTRIHRKKYKLV